MAQHQTYRIRNLLKGALRAVLPSRSIGVRNDGARIDLHGKGFHPQLHNGARPLPPGATSYLSIDNPKLLELQRAYRELDWPVCEHSRWGDVLDWLSLQYFRGESLYMWHRREDEEVTSLRYFIFLKYIMERDSGSLLSRLKDDGAFGCWTFEYPGYPTCSRDLLDCVNELSFLHRAIGIFEWERLRILEIGAGYGRLAHRAAEALPNLDSYVCVDAIPESTFLCSYYTQYRGVSPPVTVVELPDVPVLSQGDFDLAINIHSFSECTLAAIDWWMTQLERLDVRYIFIIPNEESGFLSTESDGSRRPYLGTINSHGFDLLAEEPVFADAAVRWLLSVDDRFCIFRRTVERSAR